VYVAVTTAGVRVGAAHDCTSLDVRATADSRPALDEALRRSGLGAWDGGAEADLSVAELHERAAAEDVSPGWAQRWAAMIAYAGRKGWLSGDGTIVRAHVVDLPD
jgi:hypothetical protein